MFKKFSPTATRAIAAIAVSVFAVPITSTAIVRSQDDDGLLLENAVQVHVDRSARRAEERKYWQAMRVYEELVREGVPELVKPDINDPDTYMYYLDEVFLERLNVEAATTHLSPDAAQKAYKELTERARDLLDGLRVTGFCPESLKNKRFIGRGDFPEDFYFLCQALVEEDKQRRAQAVYSPTYRLRDYNRGPGRSGAAQSLRERLQILRDSINNTTQGGVVRPDR